jgi:hypothetical protein
MWRCSVLHEGPLVILGNSGQYHNVRRYVGLITSQAACRSAHADKQDVPSRQYNRLKIITTLQNTCDWTVYIFRHFIASLPDTKLYTLSALQCTRSYHIHIPRTSGFRLSFFKVSEGRDKLDIPRPWQTGHPSAIKLHCRLQTSRAGQMWINKLSKTCTVWQLTVIAICLRQSRICTGCERRVVFLGAFVKLREAIISFVMSVRPSACHNSPRPPLGGFSWNLIFEYFSKICDENSSFIQMWQK